MGQAPPVLFPPPGLGFKLLYHAALEVEHGVVVFPLHRLPFVARQHLPQLFALLAQSLQLFFYGVKACLPVHVIFVFCPVFAAQRRVHVAGAAVFHRVAVGVVAFAVLCWRSLDEGADDRRRFVPARRAIKTCQ